MAKSQTKIMLVLAVVALVVAIILTRRQQEDTAPRFEARKLFESVDIGRLAQVRILDGEETVSLKKLSDEEWGLASRDNFPVDNERLRRLVLSVLDLEVVDQLTSKPEKYDRMGVGDTPDSGEIRLLDVDGNALAALYLGKRREPGGEGTAPIGQGQFVRAAVDPAVYVSKTALFVETQPARWLRKELLKVKADDLIRVGVDQTEPAASWAATRPSADDPFELATDLPEGKKLKSGALGGVSRALANLTLKDVIPADTAEAESIEFTATYRAVAKDGIGYEVRTGEHGGKYYARLAATVENVAMDDEGEEQKSEEASTIEGGPSAQDQVQSFNQRHQAWVYEIEKFAYDNLTTNLGALLEDEKDE